jgi:molybdate transport system ATP-binding protein
MRTPTLLTAAQAANGPVYAALRPSAVALHRRPPTPGRPRNTWTGAVSGLETVGARVRVSVAGAPSVFADITPAAAVELGLAAAEV